MSESTAGAPPPSPPTPRSKLPVVLRILGGCVVVAVIVGGGLIAERLTDEDLALPDEVAGVAADDSAEGKAFAEATSDRLSEAYNGADTVTARYGTDAKTRIIVSVARASSGPPVPAMFSKNQEWIEDGEVTCLVTRARKGAGSTLCQRDGDDLTVRVSVRGLPSLDVLVDVTDDVWEELS